MILIDTNSLVILILGLIDPKLIKSNKRTSIYEEQDFNDLVSYIDDIEKLVVLPNVWTELDNLLNKFNRGRKELYLEVVINTIKRTSEVYLESEKATLSNGFYDLGLTDSLLLEFSKKCELLITTDSKLSDYAIGNGVLVFDLVQNRNKRF